MRSSACEESSSAANAQSGNRQSTAQLRFDFETELARLSGTRGGAQDAASPPAFSSVDLKPPALLMANINWRSDRIHSRLELLPRTLSGGFARRAQPEKTDKIP
jgi:hypothetical protein